MKKVIDGKTYNTETAKKCGYWWNGFHRLELRDCQETLYRRKDGTFFLIGEGGPMSKYREPIPKGWRGSVEVIPLSEKNAKEWAEKKLDTDIYSKLFGEVKK